MSGNLFLSMDPRLPSCEVGENITDPVDRHARRRVALQMILYKKPEVGVVLGYLSDLEMQSFQTVAV